MINKKYNILLVEDNEGDIWLAKEAFSRYENCEIVVKNDGAQAIEYLSKNVIENSELFPDLIFLDLNLPKKSGEEVLNLIKNNSFTRFIPVIIMSTDDSSASVNKVYNLHANCFIVKPNTVDEYLKIIDTVVTFWFKTVSLPLVTESVKNRDAKEHLFDSVNYQLKEENKRLSLENDTLKLELSERKLMDEALRESGDRFRDIVFSMAGWIWEIDNHGISTYNSEKIEAILGFTSSEVIHKNLADILGGSRGDEFNKLIEKQQIINEFEWWTKSKSGVKICISVTGVPIISEDGNFNGYRGVIKDVTPRKKAEEKLAELNKELYRSNNDLEQFAYFASHDLREPLRMVSEFLSLLEKRYNDILDEDGRSFIDFAVQGAKRMQKMIEGLLDFSRVNTHGNKFKAVDANEVLSKVLLDLKFLIEESETTIISDKLPVLFADEVQLAHLFQNLISNSIKFKREEKCTIRIEAERDHEAWKFRFSDNGAGFDMRDADRIFGLFESLRNSDDSISTGLGLALCKRIVERHDGKIWAESALGKGTDIFFKMPFYTMQDGENQKLSSTAIEKVV